MQFITTDNRIAVENFQLGYFYTITFNNHNYIITTCTGKGDNFVSFLCSEPELVFDLTMQTADSIATIELYGGGTGTTDYNNLSNKPTINNVLLVGNKTTSDLLINDVPTVTSADDNKVLISSYSGGVGSYSWETYSPISSYNDLTDKPTINSVTLSGNKTSSDLGLQSEINSENPLLSDNVDDTDQTHKFATAAQLAQITTNQNNISSVQSNTLSEKIISTTFVWSNGYINRNGLINSSTLSQFSQPFTLHAGEKITVMTNNTSIGIINTTTEDSLNVGDTVTVLKYTSNIAQNETYTYTATEDIKITICVNTSNYVAYISVPDTNLILADYTTVEIMDLKKRVTALENT